MLYAFDWISIPLVYTQVNCFSLAIFFIDTRENTGKYRVWIETGLARRRAGTSFQQVVSIKN